MWQKLQKCGYNLVIMEAAKKLLVDPFAEAEASYRRFFAEDLKKNPIDHLSKEEQREYMRQMKLACRVLAEHDGVLKRLAE